ncbi:hypothetical protein KY290_010974 [Solanum tuberosum]|uniref:Retroviral polymerase SH3-like domain-containing protein n=1 Tax=Solanum tuberosum TaxID=4113 RepID=A0ABQ7W1W5_SOLTU|nr:hypothetical protein KY290_010974 [Solanum tuberosum]
MSKYPQQNVFSARKIAHLVSTSLSWLHDKNLRRELWAEAIQCACHVINRLPPSPVFGSTCYVHIPKTNRTKLDLEAKKCVFVGYDSYGKGWRCMDPEPKKLVTSRDIVFDEISSYHSAQKTSNQETILDDDQENFEQLPERNLQEPNNEGSSNSDDVE